MQFELLMLSSKYLVAFLTSTFSLRKIVEFNSLDTDVPL